MDTPTFAEVGLAPMNRMSSFGIIGQKTLPADIVRKINAAARTALEDPTVRQRIEESGAGVVGGTSEQYAADINAEYNQLKRVVQEQKLSLDAAN
jgi:tripartite-type tricarboxylate transporter receptor subunit TctC